MKLINELLGYRQFKDQTLPQFLLQLRQHGVKISSGSFAVAVIAEHKVYKLWLHDYAYDMYIKRVIIPLQGNPLVPVILKKPHEIPLVLRDQKPGVKVMVLERLGRTESTAYEINMLTDVYKLFELKLTWEELATSRRARKFKELIAYINNRLYRNDFVAWFNLCVREMGHFKPDGNYENIMVRGDTQPVFIDPFYDLGDANDIRSNKLLTLADLGAKRDWTMLDSNLIGTSI
jgi:hypothetical protein